FYKYVANRFLTAVQNLLTGAKLSEYHTGFRAFDKKVLLSLPLLENSDNFVFDNEILAQCICFGYRIGEVSCPTKYFAEASSINFTRSVKYGFGVLITTMKCWLQKLGMAKFRLFSPAGRKLLLDYYSPTHAEEANPEGPAGLPGSVAVARTRR
ncbi:MAG: glycosyltransferase family 2 protein, partial [Candidatus Acidiferrales bacterium]